MIMCYILFRMTVKYQGLKYELIQHRKRNKSHDLVRHGKHSAANSFGRILIFTALNIKSQQIVRRFILLIYWRRCKAERRQHHLDFDKLTV